MSKQHNAKPPGRLRALPSLNLLRGFESAGRLGSFSDAAREVGVTQGAISRQIKSLEEALGVRLFVRDQVDTKLTEAGHRYWEVISRSINDMEAATQALLEADSVDAVTFRVLPSFATKWLIPRIRGFQDQNPLLRTRIETSNEPAIGRIGINRLVIAYLRDPPDGAWLKLATETLIAVCHPDYCMPGAELAEEKDILKLPLLANSTRPTMWQEFLGRVGLESPHALRIEPMLHFYLTIQGALARVGVALVPDLLVEAELENGQLVCPFELSTFGPGAYYVSEPVRGSSDATLAAYEWVRNCFAAAATNA